MSYTKIDSLVARSKSGDHAAAGELLQLFLLKIYKLSAGIDNIDDRQDCVQDLSIAFLQGVKKFDENQGSPFNAFISKHLSLEMSKWLDDTHKNTMAVVQKNGKYSSRAQPRTTTTPSP